METTKNNTPTVPPVSIVIPTLNEEGYLPLLLDSLRNISAPFDIIVVDGNSEDDTARVVSNYQTFFSGDSRLRLLSSPKRGISEQRNRGAEQAVHEIIMFCDADIVFPAQADYVALVSLFQKNNYAAAAPMLVPIESGLRIQLLFGLLHFFQKSLILFRRPYFAGACLLTTKKVFAGIGGFDTAVLLGEDIDYSLRAGQTGPCGFIKIKMPVSARRFVKYGYGWIFKDFSKVIELLVRGRVKKTEDIFYPFGDFGKPPQ